MVDICPLSVVRNLSNQVIAPERTNLTTMTFHATPPVFHTPSRTYSKQYSGIRSVKYSWCIRSGLLLTYLTAIYTTACGADKQNDQLQRLRCTAEGFWCVHVCPWSRTLDSGTLDRLMKLFSTAALQNFWHATNGIYMYVCFATSTSRSHAHQSARPVGSMSQILILSSTSSEGVVPTGGRYGSVPTGVFSRVLISVLRLRLTYYPFGRSTRLRGQPSLSP